MAVFFLEADPWFFHSGYVKEAILRRLNRLSLTPRLIERLNRVLLAAVDGRDRREFRRYCRLAAAIATPRVSSALRERLASRDAGVRRRAEWMLAAIERRPVRPEVMIRHVAWYRAADEAATRGVDFQAPDWMDQLKGPLPAMPRHVRYGYGDRRVGGWRLRRLGSLH